MESAALGEWRLGLQRPGEAILTDRTTRDPVRVNTVTIRQYGIAAHTEA